MAGEKERVDCERIGLDYFDTAPLRVVVAQEMATTPDRLFEVFLDADAWPRWAFPITGVEWTSGLPIEVGSTRTVRMRGAMVGWEEFLAWEPGARMAFRFNETVKGGPAAFAEDYRITDLGGGRTRVEWTMALTLSGFSARLTAVTRPAMRFANARMLRKLGAYVAALR
jgi:uncharacterized protein YndB with AHSA1/START domain